MNLKRSNPDFPILVRECSGVQARVWARYGGSAVPGYLEVAHHVNDHQQVLTCIAGQKRRLLTVVFLEWLQGQTTNLEKHTFTLYHH